MPRKKVSTVTSTETETKVKVGKVATITGIMIGLAAIISALFTFLIFN